MYTIQFFGGTVKHVTKKRGQAIAAAKVKGDEVIGIDGIGEAIDLRSVARVMPFKEWQHEEEQKLMSKGKDMYICDFGSLHYHYENCPCAEEGRQPCTEEAITRLVEPAPQLSPVKVLKDGKVIETL